MSFILVHILIWSTYLSCACQRGPYQVWSVPWRGWNLPTIGIFGFKSCAVQNVGVLEKSYGPHSVIEVFSDYLLPVFSGGGSKDEGKLVRAFHAIWTLGFVRVPLVFSPMVPGSSRSFNLAVLASISSLLLLVQKGSKVFWGNFFCCK